MAQARESYMQYHFFYEFAYANFFLKIKWWNTYYVFDVKILVRLNRNIMRLNRN